MKSKWKQIMAILLIFVLLLAFPGCMSGDHKDTEEFAGLEDTKVSVDHEDTEVSAAEGFVLLSDIAPDVIQEIRYYSTYNFVGERIDGYEEPCALMTKEAAAALNEVSKDVMSMGYRLKVYDAYRPQMAVDHFVRWAEDLEDTYMKSYFYPEVDKTLLFDQGYIDAKSGHSRGSTVDLTLFDMSTGKEVDMGGTFDYFGELSHPDYTETLTDQQYANRMILQEAMIRHGFRPLDTEWWHFTLEDEPYPDTYFEFPVSSESVPDVQEEKKLEFNQLKETQSEKTGDDVVSDLMADMTLREKVGQLFIVRPDALDFTQTQEHIDDVAAVGITELTDDIRSSLEGYPVGGVALFGKNIDTPEQLKQFNADWKTVGKIPLFITVDEEGGRVARLANSEGFELPKYESASAVEDAGQMGHTIGAYLKEYGFNVDFAPVADVNSNPDNPVIGTRAFSDDAGEVRDKAASMAAGLESEGILPVYKHFPGHGDTAEDSHAQLAVTHKSTDQLREVEWVPYQNQKLDAVMVAHVAAPEVGVDGPASLSHTAVTDWLRGELGHEGLIITDSLSMGAIMSAYTPGEAALQALNAGVDILLMPGDLREAFDAVVDAVKSGNISEDRIDESVKRILTAKQKLGLFDN